MKFELRPRSVALGVVALGLGAAIYMTLLPLRERSQKVRCQTNLKQIGLATLQYVRDYDEKFMLARNWKDAVEPYGKFNRSPSVDRTYACPKTARDYAYNIHFGGNSLEAVPLSWTTALFHEPAHPVNADGGQSWATQGIHGDGSNVCFADGHVKWLRTKPVFWTPQLELQTRTLARRAALDQAKQWHDYRAYLQKLKQRKSNP